MSVSTFNIQPVELLPNGVTAPIRSIGTLVRTLPPFSAEAMEFMCSGGMARHGVFMEKR